MPSDSSFTSSTISKLRQLIVCGIDCGKTHVTDDEVRERSKKNAPDATMEIGKLLDADLLATLRR